METPLCDLVEVDALDLVRRYRASSGAARDRVRNELLAVLAAPVAAASRERFSGLCLDVEDQDELVGIGYETLHEHLDAYLDRFDSRQGDDLVRFITAANGSWYWDTRNRVTAYLNPAMSKKQRSIIKSWHEYEECEERDVSSFEDWLIDRKSAALIAHDVDLDAAAAREKAQAALVKDGVIRAARDIDETRQLDIAARVEQIAEEALRLPDQEPVPDVGGESYVPAMLRVATLGMDGRVRRRALRVLQNVSEVDGEAGMPAEDGDIREIAAANLADPIAVFVATAGIENQFVEETGTSDSTGSLLAGARAALLASA